MILNILILIFLLLMAAWYSGQGLYTALYHLLLTVFSGALALAFWEPITQGFLLGVIPEYAWGVGLLVPFALILSALRQLFDRLLIGNQDFHNMINKAGGGAAGFASGVITAGLALIGLQMAGMPDVMGYQGWEVKNGRPAKAQQLWVPVDRITADLFERFGGGSLHPLGSDQSLPRVHPNLAAEASLYTQGAFELSRRAIRPSNVEFLQENPYFAVSQPPAKLAEKLPGSGGGQIVVLGTKVTLQPSEGSGAADEDAAFRVSRNQVALLCATEAGPAEVHLPVGYIQNGEFESLAAEGSYAFSNPSVPRVRHRWVFQVPAGCTPLYLRMKQIRLAVSGQPNQDGAQLASLLTYTAPETAEGEDEDSGQGRMSQRPQRRTTGGGSRGQSSKFVSIDDGLPFPLNKNALASENVEYEENAIRAGSGTVEKGDRPGGNLRIDTIYSAPTAEIVQVNLGSPDRASSVLGGAMEFARNNTQPPQLVDDRGDPYFSIGYGIVSKGQYTFDIDPNRTLRSLTRVNLGNISEDEDLILYFQIPHGTRLTEFRLGQSNSESIDLTVE